MDDDLGRTDVPHAIGRDVGRVPRRGAYGPEAGAHRLRERGRSSQLSLDFRRPRHRRRRQHRRRVGILLRLQFELELLVRRPRGRERRRRGEGGTIHDLRHGLRDPPSQRDRFSHELTRTRGGLRLGKLGGLTEVRVHLDRGGGIHELDNDAHAGRLSVATGNDLDISGERRPVRIGRPDRAVTQRRAPVGPHEIDEVADGLRQETVADRELELELRRTRLPLRHRRRRQREDLFQTLRSVHVADGSRPEVVGDTVFRSRNLSQPDARRLAHEGDVQKAQVEGPSVRVGGPGHRDDTLGRERELQVVRRVVRPKRRRRTCFPPGNVRHDEVAGIGSGFSRGGLRRLNRRRRREHPRQAHDENAQRDRPAFVHTSRHHIPRFRFSGRSAVVRRKLQDFQPPAEV